MNAEPETPEDATRRDRSILAFYFVYLFMVGVPAAASAWTVYVWVPTFQGVFKDFRTVLPRMTTRLLGFSEWCHSPFVWPLLVVGLLIVPGLLAKLTVRFKNAMQRLTAAMMVMMVLMFVTFSGWMLVQAALFLPLVKLIQSVSGGGGE